MAANVRDTSCLLAALVTSWKASTVDVPAVVTAAYTA